MKTKNIYKIGMHVLLIIGSVIMIFPFIWMILTSFQSLSESTSVDPFVFFPDKWLTDNYETVINQNNFFVLYFNTFAMMFFRIVCVVGFSAMAAYAFARLDFPGKNFFFGLVLFQMM